MTALVRRCALKTAGPIYAESTSCGDLREIAAMPRNDEACAPLHVATRRRTCAESLSMSAPARMPQRRASTRDNR